MYVYICKQDIYINIYTQCKFYIKKMGRRSSLYMQGARPGKNKKYKLVLVLMRGWLHTGHISPWQFLWSVSTDIGASFKSPVKASKSDDMPGLSGSTILHMHALQRRVLGEK